MPRTEREINEIRGKLLVSAASQKEINDFLRYTSELESLVDEADGDDYFGTEGWRHRVGWGS